MTTTDGHPPIERRRLTRTTKICTALIMVLALLEGSALTVRYLLTDRRYVIADNAQVDGDKVEIHAPTDGLVVDWRVDTGSPVTANQIVGRVEIIGSAVRSRKPIRSPGRGTLAQNTVSNGMYVTAGALLATAYDPAGIYVTARIHEEDIDAVHRGAAVDILLATDPDAPVTGVVDAISPAAAGVNQLDGSPAADPLDLDYPIYPGSDTDPQNPQKVDQYIPVKILFTDVGTAAVTPGESVTVHIHRQ